MEQTKKQTLLQKANKKLVKLQSLLVYTLQKLQYLQNISFFLEKEKAFILSLFQNEDILSSFFMSLLINLLTSLAITSSISYSAFCLLFFLFASYYFYLIQVKMVD